MNTAALNDRIFREYDIRGIAGKDLSREIAFSLGLAFGFFVKSADPQAEWVSVGRDVRLSSEDLTAGLVEGIISAGLNVYDIGVCPTPLQYFSIFHLDLDGGVMITGSHNPPEYNGFKISVGKETIHGEDIQALKGIIQKHGGAKAEKRGRVEKYHIADAYKRYMLNEFSGLANSRFKRLKAVVDAGNGTAGIVVPELLSAAGCDVVPLFCEPDGNFPNHHPDPTVIENIQTLVAEVKRSGADIGVGYDGDADRIGVVDSEGNIVWGDQIMIILSREILRENPGAKVIGDVKCSQIMFDSVEKNGGIPIMWKTGHSLIKQKMREEKALIAGEFSGHIFVAHRYFGFDDAIYTTLRLIEVMKCTGFGIRELLSDVPRMYYTPEIRLDCPDDKKKPVVSKIVSNLISYDKSGKCPCEIVKLNTLDGIRIVFEKGWGLARASNTQPVVVMRVEAEDEISLHRYKDFLEAEFTRTMEEL